MLALTAARAETAGGDVTTIFLLTSGLLFALSVAGVVWIRITASEYRHRWALQKNVNHTGYRNR
jgi:hypothetical protein